MRSFEAFVWQAIRKRGWRFILVSAIGTFFSFPLYLFLRHEGLSKYVASPISNLVAQAIDFFPHKLLTFREKSLDGKVVTLEALIYGAVASALVAIEPALLDFAEGAGLNAPLAWCAVHPFTGLARLLLYELIFQRFHNHKSPNS